jgi:hypothetical protein
MWEGFIFLQVVFKGDGVSPGLLGHVLVELSPLFNLGILNFIHPYWKEAPCEKQGKFRPEKEPVGGTPTGAIGTTALPGAEKVAKDLGLPFGTVPQRFGP